jgi:hypothetical protein
LEVGEESQVGFDKAAVVEEGHHKESWTEYRVLRRLQKKQTWQHHQSVGAMAWGRCCWGKFPGLKKSKEKVEWSYRTISRCKECSAKNGIERLALFGGKREQGVAMPY